jgi:Flp pilus assembly protein TadD
MSPKSLIILGGSFYTVFLLLTPLGVFNDGISPPLQTGYYSATVIDAGDDAGYYAYLRSLFFDGDIDFINERHYAHAGKLTPTGYVFNNWQIGQGLLFLPFFLIGHGLALLYGALGYPVAADGYSAPYLLATAVASGTWLFAGLILVVHLVRNVARERVAWVTALSLWLASPLLYFTFIRQRMAHTLEFAVSALLIVSWLHWRKSQDLFKYAVLGGILGLLCMVRIINVAFFALIAVDLLVTLRAENFSPLSRRVKSAVLRFAVFSGGFLLLMSPQLVCWYKLNGIPLPPRHLHFAGEGLAGFDPSVYLMKLSSLLWSPKWGLIWSMPLALAGLLGLFMKNGFLKEVRPALLAYLAGIFSIILLYPEDSASYGHRHLISALPVFALGLARLLEWCSHRKILWPVALSFVVLAVLAQYFMIVQYKVSLPYNHPQFTWEALANIPHLLLERPGQLLRSTNIFRLLLQDNLAETNFWDVLFLVIFPVAQFIAILGVGWMVVRFPVNARMQTLFSSPKNLLATGILTSLILIGILTVSAPAKTPAEIQARQDYFKRLKAGDALLAVGKLEPARSVYRQAAELLPSHWNPYFRLGASWNMEANLNKANAFYIQGLRLNPTHTQALTRYGGNLNFQGKFAQAESVLKDAIRSWPFNKSAYDALAQVYIKTNKPDLAVSRLQQALSIDPNFGAGHANLAVAYTLMNAGEMAVVHLNRAMALGIKGPVVDQLVNLYDKKTSGPGPHYKLKASESDD